ncbi:uncharacterized protein B0H94_11220 [Salsuginibacillus halophilus]|uniref:DUF418 domain-containing protein n=1 Tax=Salsuginibacillus halophilus TaxID=517424 RepID=A0A2P8H9N3_9BACI|nr:DUF418 domain-containing protein [Salsuginibacillus halophilus]PSL42937.1 uncharacterized protein B0H94_11220 [Salsuginibacillus halophilus]
MKNQEPAGRIQTLDVIRGAALIGIFLVNISLMTSLDYLKYMSAVELERTGIDRGLELLIQWLVEGSFITMFSFLFGVGFYIFMSRAESKGHQVKRLFSRRLVGLLAFGLLHLVFLWMGDILTLYALTGFLLLMFYKRKTKTILIWAFVSLGLFFLLMLSQTLMPANMVKQIQTESKGMVEDAAAAYAAAPSLEWLTYRLTVEVPFVAGGLPFLMLFVLGLFLLGFYAGRKQWFYPNGFSTAWFKRLRNVCLALSVPFVALDALYEFGIFDAGVHEFYLTDTIMRLSAIFLGFAYIAMFALWVESGKWAELQRTLAAMGRMALTNYLMQTLLVYLIVFSTGTFGSWSLWQNVLLVFSIIILQAVLSRVWLSRYQQGPLENVWRRFTYAKS